MKNEEMNPDRQRCNDLHELLPLFVYGEVSAGERRQVERHLRHCESCRVDLRRLEFAKTTLDQVDEIALPKQASPEISSNSTSIRSRRLPTWGKTISLIAATGLLAIAVFGLEIKVSSQAVTIRWNASGSPNRSESLSDSARKDLSVDTKISESEFRDLRDELVLTRQLVHALAANVDTDRTTSENLYQLITRRLNSIETGVRRNDFRLNSKLNNELAAR